MSQISRTSQASHGSRTLHMTHAASQAAFLAPLVGDDIVDEPSAPAHPDLWRPTDSVTDPSVWIAVTAIMLLVSTFGLSEVLQFKNTSRLYSMVSDDKFTMLLMYAKSVFTTPVLLATIPMYRTQMKRLLLCEPEATPELTEQPESSFKTGWDRVFEKIR